MASEHAEHGYTPPKAAYDDLNIRSIALVGGVGAVLVFVAVVAVQVIYFRYEHAEFERKVLEMPTASVDEALAAQRAQLATVGASAGPDRGVTSVPIDEAMRLVVEEYRQRQSAEEAGEEPPADAAPEGDAAVTGETADGETAE